MSNFIEFNFSMLDYVKETESNREGDNRQYDFDPCSFEKYMLKFYILNILKRNKNTNIITSSIGLTLHTVSDFINKYAYCANLNLNESTIKKYTTQISNIEGIQKILQMTYKKEGKAYISLCDMYRFPELLPILKKLLNELLAEELNKLKRIDIKKLNKAYYTKNFEYLINKMNIKNKKIIEVARLSLYSHINYFSLFTPISLDKRSDFYKNASTYLGYNIKELDFSKYKDVLFFYDCNGGLIEYFTISSRMLEACCKKYKNQEDCLKSLLIKIDTKEILTRNDFKHIKQYDYISNILKTALKNHTKGVNILFYGKPGTGKSALAKVLMHELTNDIYEVPVKEDTINNISTGITSMNSINNIRKSWYNSMQAILNNNHNSLILYDEAEDFFRKNYNADQSKSVTNNILETNNIPTIWTTNSLHDIEQSFLRRFTYTLNIDFLSTDSYQTIINKLKNKYKIDITDEINETLIQYKPSIGITEKLLKNYKISNKDPKEFKQDLMDSLKCLNYGENISKLPINQFKFNPELINSSIDLNDLTVSIKQSGRLDFSLLLYGVPGSSKTSYGKYLAEQLGLKVINKSYTELSSMWVGETEKNIAALFEEAEQERALILLDECDALLQDRTKAFRSWEISQTEALLTAMENHSYPFVMTTNLYNNLDSAVMRRILYKVKHDYLKPEQIRLAFKHFFDINIVEDLHLSKLTSGDFAVVKKQAEFQNKLKDKEWLINKLIEEMNQKKTDIQKEIKF